MVGRESVCLPGPTWDSLRKRMSQTLTDLLVLEHPVQTVAIYCQAWPRTVENPRKKKRNITLSLQGEECRLELSTRTKDFWQVSVSPLYKFTGTAFLVNA